MWCGVPHHEILLRSPRRPAGYCPQVIRSILGVSLMPCKVWPLRVQTGQIRQGAAGAAYGMIGSPGKRCRGCFVADRGLWPLHPDAGGFGQAERRPRVVRHGLRPIILGGTSCWRCGVFRPGRPRSAADRGRRGRNWLGKMWVWRRARQAISTAYLVEIMK